MPARSPKAAPSPAPQVARIYLRVSTDEQDLQRQEAIIADAKAAGKYTGRKADTKVHERIVALRANGRSIAETARLAACSASQVKRVWAQSKGGLPATKRTTHA